MCSDFGQLCICVSECAQGTQIEEHSKDSERSVNALTTIISLVLQFTVVLTSSFPSVQFCMGIPVWTSSWFLYRNTCIQERSSSWTELSSWLQPHPNVATHQWQSHTQAKNDIELVALCVAVSRSAHKRVHFSELLIWKLLHFMVCVSVIASLPECTVISETAY